MNAVEGITEVCLVRKVPLEGKEFEVGLWAKGSRSVSSVYGIPLAVWGMILGDTLNKSRDRGSKDGDR